MSLMTEVKKEIVDAMKAKNNVKKDILRLVVGEVQTIESRENKILADDQVESIIRKLVQKNEETINLCENQETTDKLKQENTILNNLLPQTLTQPEIEEYLKPVTDEIVGANSDGQAMGMAMKLLKSKNLSVLGNDVKKVVEKIRV